MAAAARAAPDGGGGANERRRQLRVECFAPRSEHEGPQSIVIECSDGRRCVVDGVLVYMHSASAGVAASPTKPPKPAIDLGDLDEIDNIATSIAD